MQQKINYLLAFFGLMAISLNAQVEHHQSHSMTTSSKKSLSPHSMAMAMIGDAHVHIEYSAPSVRDRIIFGGLVAFDRVWQAGAHMATWIETDKDLLIKGNELPAGKYGFFLIPGKEEWTVIFNTRWDQHGKDEYNEEEDVLRVNVTPANLKELQETLSYEVNRTGERTGQLLFSWEKKRIQLPFEVRE